MTLDQFQGAGLDPPAGCIAMQDDPGDSLPDGWMFCDGNNGTPDLRGRHLRGVPTAGTDPGSRGGANTKTLSEAEMPSHSHGGSTSSDGSHRHHFSNYWGTNYTGNDATNGYVPNGGSNDYNRSTNADGDHSHTSTVGTVGSDATIDNQPANRTITFIQRA